MSSITDTREVPVRHSHLSRMNDAPCFARAAMLGIEDDETKEEDKGSAVHAMVFNTQLVVPCPMPRDPTKEKYREWAREYDGCRIVTQKDHDHAMRLNDAIRRHSGAMKLFEGAQCEITRYFDLEGRKCQATPDAVGRGYIADLKTARSANPERFMWQAQELHYHSAMAWYQRSVPTARDVYLVVVDKRRPYPVQVYKYDDEDLALGRELHEAWFARLLECERTGHWPDFGNGDVLPMSLPRKKNPERVD